MQVRTGHFLRMEDRGHTIRAAVPRKNDAGC